MLNRAAAIGAVTGTLAVLLLAGRVWGDLQLTREESYHYYERFTARVRDWLATPAGRALIAESGYVPLRR